MLYCDSNRDCYSVTLLITFLTKRAKIYIFHCYKSLGVWDKHRLKTPKKLLDRKTEEAVSLAQNSGRSDLIPDWCLAPDDISPPAPSPPSRSKAALLEDLEALGALEALEVSAPPKRGKKKKKAAHQQESLGSHHADEGLGTVDIEEGVGSPREKLTVTPPPEQALESPLAPNTVPQKEEDLFLLSLTDHLKELGNSSFKLPKGWADFDEHEFNLVITDALAAMGIEKSDLPEGWTMVVRRRKRKTVHTLPNIPEFFVGEMHKHH